MSVTARFDGRVFVPDGPVDLPVGSRVRLVPEPADDAGLEGASAEVRDFCAAHQLGGPVTQLLELVRKSMTGLARTELRVEKDPDSDDRWLVVAAIVEEGATLVLSTYDAVLARWFEATDPRARDRIRFTLSFA